MGNYEEQKSAMEIEKLLLTIKERKPPVVHEHSTIHNVVDITIKFDHSRVVYVQDETGKLSGTISLGSLAKYVFYRSHDPQIHARGLMSMITAAIAKDMMHKRPVFAMKNKEVESVLRRMIVSNVKEIPILDKDRRVIAGITMLDLLKFLLTTVGNNKIKEKSHDN